MSLLYGTLFKTSLFKGDGGDGGDGVANLLTVLNQQLVPITAAAGTVLGILQSPLGTVFSLVGTVPDQLALSGATIVSTNTAGVVNITYPLRVRVVSSDTLTAYEQVVVFSTIAGSGVLGAADFSDPTNSDKLALLFGDETA